MESCSEHFFGYLNLKQHLQPLTDLFMFPGEIDHLLLNLSPGITLSLNFLLQLLNMGLEQGQEQGGDEYYNSQKHHLLQC